MLLHAAAHLERAAHAWQLANPAGRHPAPPARPDMPVHAAAASCQRLMAPCGGSCCAHAAAAHSPPCCRRRTPDEHDLAIQRIEAHSMPQNAAAHRAGQVARRQQLQLLRRCRRHWGLLQASCGLPRMQAVLYDVGRLVLLELQLCRWEVAAVAAGERRRRRDANDDVRRRSAAHCHFFAHPMWR